MTEGWGRQGLTDVPFEKVDVSAMPYEAMMLYVNMRERGWRERGGTLWRDPVGEDGRYMPPEHRSVGGNEEDWSHLQALTLLADLMETYEGGVVTGPSDEDTRKTAMMTLIKVRRAIGGDELRVDDGLVVAPNYIVTLRQPTEEERRDVRNKKYPRWVATNALFIDYRLCFELYMVVPLHYEETGRLRPKDDRTMYNRVKKDKGMRFVGPPPDRMGELYLGRIKGLVLDMESRLATIMTGSVKGGNLFDITFSIREKNIPADFKCNYKEGDFVYPFVDEAVHREPNADTEDEDDE